MADITFRCFINRNGKIESFNGYTEAEKNEIEQRLSKNMSIYFTSHPDEWKRLLKKIRKN